MIRSHQFKIIMIIYEILADCRDTSMVVFERLAICTKIQKNVLYILQEIAKNTAWPTTSSKKQTQI